MTTTHMTTARAIPLPNGDVLLCPGRSLTQQVLPPQSQVTNVAAQWLAIFALTLGIGLAALAVFQ